MSSPHSPDEEEQALSAIKRYTPPNPEEARRAFVLVMTLSDSDTAANGKQLVEKMHHLENYLKEGHKPEVQRPIRVV